MDVQGNRLIVWPNVLLCCVAVSEESVLSKEEIAEIEMKETEQRQKEKIQQTLKLREMETAAENTGNSWDTFTSILAA